MNIEKMRTDSDPDVRWDAAMADAYAGRDLAWVRADSDHLVRRVAAMADVYAGRDLAWAKADSDHLVRWVGGGKGKRKGGER